MDINDIVKIELEITSNCNAACPGCARTQHREILEIQSFGIDDLVRLFPNSKYIKNKKFKFCGVLGDPALNKDAIEMAKYIAGLGGNCQWSTNGAYQTAEWWKTLGKLSNDTQVIDVNFCVDGHKETNHIYRVGTNWKVLERNMTAYSNAGGKATWVYIVFDHNENELEKAKKHAKELGFCFQTRTGMRNSYHNWIAKIGNKKVNNNFLITTTGKKEHSKKDKVKKLDEFISKKNKTQNEIANTLQTICCKMIHEGEIFISSKLELWPCCFLWDSAFKNAYNINQKLHEYPTGWNSLQTNTIDEVLSHVWFKKILEESWNPNHKKHITRCIKTCASNKAYQNEFFNVEE